MVIQIQLQDDTWKYLNQLKKAGDTFDDVIKKELMMNPHLKINKEDQNETK